METPDSKLVTPREIALLSADEAYKKLNSSQKGLTTAKAAESRAQFGTNFLPELPTPPIWKKFLLQFRDLFAVLLLIAAGISFVAYILGGRDLYSLKVCIAIICVVLLNASIGFVQGYMAERATSMLQKLVPHNARVLRDGGEVIIPTTELVPGDIILLEEGDDVLISGFGKFCVREKRQRRGRNPQTGEPMALSPRRVVTFHYSGILKEKINHPQK